MAIVPQHYILPRMRNDLATLSGGQGHPYIWNDPSTYGGSAVRYEDLGEFVAALPSKTTTGALREHIMRLNSTASCTSVDMSAFPATCAGGNPFQASLQYKALYDWGNSDANISAVDICAPGDLGRHPWTLSRNRQELSEEVFLKITGDNYRNGVIHCTGQTTRGYFELGNVHNGGAFGPLLEKWPSGGSSLAEYQFHDYMRSEWIGESQYDQGGYLPPRPNNTLAYPPRTYTNTSGPLMTSIVALFGATSWAHSLANLTSSRDEDAKTLQTTYADRPGLLTSLCAGLPFAKPGDTYGEVICASSLLHLMSTYSDHMVGWGLNETAATRLSTAMSLANQAALTAHTTGLLPWSRSTGREIYAAPGIVVSKPTVSLPGLVILSAVVAAHVFGLLCLALWILRYPTWTRTLDARAVARIVAHMDGSVFPALRTTGQADWEALAHVSGLVGAEPHDDMVEQRGSSGTVHARAAEVEMEMDMEIEMRALSVASTVGKQATSEVAPASTNASRVTLGLGAPGVIAGRWGKQVVASAEHADA
ncbi:uncharacterized protein M421DRAFT_69417 [Didymella exigua CBS 183.55]|uniref:Uncharacterized protein n=1 Tax=Didymella exigua CBS 183.55 TaxID=1150837 RepID=A0A6A5RF13_9PLEO|nr:uncharacterized protein M421DRAFT_69417 [Didymella exigua CBS 183.55]KAF1925694.1 hypothetical protein M421DRAFT_69417 [Didymella exigua CBS 183.55]